MGFSSAHTPASPMPIAQGLSDVPAPEAEGACSCCPTQLRVPQVFGEGCGQQHAGSSEGSAEHLFATALGCL